MVFFAKKWEPRFVADENRRRRETGWFVGIVWTLPKSVVSLFVISNCTKFSSLADVVVKESRNGGTRLLNFQEWSRGTIGSVTPAAKCAMDMHLLAWGTPAALTNRVYIPIGRDCVVNVERTVREKTGIVDNDPNLRFAGKPPCRRKCRLLEFTSSLVSRNVKFIDPCSRVFNFLTKSKFFPDQRVLTEIRIIGMNAFKRSERRTQSLWGIYLFRKYRWCKKKRYLVEEIFNGYPGARSSIPL